jgi:hypothetical protein
MNQRKKGLLALCLALLLALTGCEQVMERTSEMVRDALRGTAAQREGAQSEPEGEALDQGVPQLQQSHGTEPRDDFVLDLAQLPP